MKLVRMKKCSNYDTRDRFVEVPLYLPGIQGITVLWGDGSESTIYISEWNFSKKKKIDIDCGIGFTDKDPVMVFVNNEQGHYITDIKIINKG